MNILFSSFFFFFFNDTATTEIYTLSLHDALPDLRAEQPDHAVENERDPAEHAARSEEHTSELQSHLNLVCRLLLEKKKKKLILKIIKNPKNQIPKNNMKLSIK